MELTFSSDTKHRKQYFTGLHFSHPAKMHLSLQLWIIENYTKPGELILDPMAGSGTILVACPMGRNIIAVELESKFIKIMEGNWEKIRKRPMMGYEMGSATILQGDARNLEGILADKIISSPPYAETLQGSGADAVRRRIAEGKYKGLRPDVWISKGNIAGSTFGDGYSEGKDNISNLPYGTIDKVITSPPYEGSIVDGNENFEGMRHLGTINKNNIDKKRKQLRDYQFGKDTTAYGRKVDSIITSPPYETPMKYDGENKRKKILNGHKLGKRDDVYFSKGNVAWQGLEAGYGQSVGNIGNLKGATYLQAMLQVYQQCFKVLKLGGLLILVTKNFIRNKQEVRLDEDTIKLCETAGFTFKERHYRKLTAQSFWRTIYQQKYPDAPVLDKEDVLVFSK